MELKRHKSKVLVPRSEVLLRKRDVLLRKVNILGIEVDDISLKFALDAIIKMAAGEKRGKYVVTVNSEFVMLARRNREFCRILNNADLALADGVGVVWAKLIFGGKEHDRIAGVDLVEKLCEISAKKAIVVGFLGGFGDLANMVKVRQIFKNPGLKVVFADPGDPAMGYDLRLKRQLAARGGVDILFVAYGMGQQEFWIDRVKSQLPVGVFIGVGGAFDYLSMVKKRAPGAAQRSGFEWLWRLILEPRRAWRMRVLPIFAILVFLAWFRKNLTIFDKNY